MPSLGEAWRRFAAGLVHAVWRWFQQAGTITGDTAAGRRFGSFGPGSLIAFPTGSIYGEQWIRLGTGTMIGEYASICAGMAPGHDLGPDPVLRIGDRCVIGRGSHIVAHHSIDIGDDVFTGPYVYITDQNHSYADPDLPIGRQWPVNAPVTIGAGTWLGTGVIVLPGSVIGRNVVVAAGAVVRGVIGDRCVIAGVPARIVKDFEPETGWTRPGGGDVGPRSGTAPAETGAPEAMAREADLTDLTGSGLTEAGLTEAALAEPMATDHSLARPLLAERDS
jgi:carbonic anhydrase/acetyltransferase-like protein (isoleucine patch superfamily)